MHLIKRHAIKATGNGDIVSSRLNLAQTLDYLFI